MAEPDIPGWTEAAMRVRKTMRGLPFVLGSLVACSHGDEPAPPRSPTVTDSSGLRIVHNPSVRDAPPGWTVRGPLLEIGELEGDPEYELFRVRGAQRLSDGRIVVANDGSRELRFYDSLGRHVLSAGGEGDGPGELEAIRSGGLRRFGTDSLLVLDLAQGRVSIFDGGGSFVRSFTLGGLHSPVLAGAFADGGLLVYEPFDLGARIEPGVRRTEVELYRISPRGERRRSLGSFPGPENYMHVGEGWARGVLLWFGRSLEATVAGDRVIVGSTDTYELRMLDRRGKPLRLIRMEHESVPLRPEDFDALRSERLGFMDPDRRARWEEVYDAMPRPRTLPAFRTLMGDPEGNLWVRDYLPPGDERWRWTVFDSAGRALGKIETPPGLWVWEIGPDYLLGYILDELGVERVQLWALEKGPQGR